MTSCKAATSGRGDGAGGDVPERVLGVDPGLGTTGYAVLQWTGNKLRVEEAGVIRARSRGSLAERVAEIHRGLVDVIAALHPTVMALEELYSHYKRPRTAILMGHARGVICLAAAQAAKSDIPVGKVDITSIQRALGQRADR